MSIDRGQAHWRHKSVGCQVCLSFPLLKPPWLSLPSPCLVTFLGVLFLLCVMQDGRNMCAAAPLLSLIKQEEQLDVLVPAFKPHHEPQWVPWSEKSDLAFFRWAGGWAGWGGVGGQAGAHIERDATCGPGQPGAGGQEISRLRHPGGWGGSRLIMGHCLQRCLPP